MMGSKDWYKLTLITPNERYSTGDYQSKIGLFMGGTRVEASAAQIARFTYPAVVHLLGLIYFSIGDMKRAYLTAP